LEGFFYLYQIDFSSDSFNAINITDEMRHLREFTNDLLEQIDRQRDNRKFQVIGSSTQINRAKEAVKAFGSEERTLSELDNIANSFIQIRKEATDKYGERIQKGSLFQAYSKEDGKSLFMITVVDHADFLDDEDHRKHEGMPYDNKILKSCVISFDENRSVKDIYVYDSNSRISKYWWESFLQLTPVTDDEDNTRKSFKQIDNAIVKVIRETSPTDYHILKDSLIGYYASNRDFLYENLMDSVFRNYQSKSIDNELYKKLLQNLELLPERQGFDRRFSISKTAVSRLFRQTFRLSEHMELTLLGGSIQEFSNLISPVIEGNINYLKIRVDSSSFAIFSEADKDD